jgi:hypothetical protein
MFGPDQRPARQEQIRRNENWFVITGAILICFNVKVLSAKSSTAAPCDRDKPKLDV